MSTKIVQRFVFGETIPMDAAFLFYDKDHQKPLVYEVRLKAEKSARTTSAGNDIDLMTEEIVNYLNKITGSKYTTRAKATTSHIRARILEGRTVADFISVIDKKWIDWGEDPKWSKYLRPETLFGTKFDGYLSQKGIGDVSDEAFGELDGILAGIK